MLCNLCDLAKQVIVVQNKYCVCMVNYEPLKDGHLMLLPKRHVVKLKNLTKDESVAINNILEKMISAFKKIYSEDPIIFINTGRHSTQEHLHFHILPSRGGLRDLISSFENIPKRAKADQRILLGIAKKIQKYL